MYIRQIINLFLFVNAQWHSYMTIRAIDVVSIFELIISRKLAKLCDYTMYFVHKMILNDKYNK